MNTALQIAMAGYLFFGQLVPSDQNRIVKHAGLQVIHADGSVTLRLKESSRSAMTLVDGELHTIVLQDEYQPLMVTRRIRTWNDCDAVETWIEVKNDENGPVKLLHADSFATTITTDKETVEVHSLTGTWAYEANLHVAPVAPGQIVELRSCEGTRDAWESNAAIMLSFRDGECCGLADKDYFEEHGEFLGVALEWTGTTSRRIRRNWNGKEVSVMAGVDMTTGPYTLDQGKTFVSPKAIIVRSDKGRGEVSRQYHRWARKHLMPHGEALRPILLNHWEGAGFDITEDILAKMMDGVKDMGGEMFVLDDGWFGHGKYARDARNRDTAGLGDWEVNPEVLPHGLSGLADAAAKRGLGFGFWVEPEMVNTKSWLAEAHPEWLLREEGRPLALGRGGTQTVLDFCNPSVREHVWKQLDGLYKSVPSLAYIKWDCNQHISNPGSTYLAADRQPNLWYDYTIGLYDMLATMRAKYPQVMIQACASGGGHVDFGFLRYADECWASDDTDSYQRIFIQWGESLFYPACALAAHVTEVPNQTTKRIAPLKHRFDVAMTARLGFELVPEKLSGEEIEFSKKAVADYKRIRPVVQLGDLYRLASPYEHEYASLMYVNEKRDHAAVFVLGTSCEYQADVQVKCRGLDPEKAYEIVEINRGERLHAAEGCKLSGAELMDRGFVVELNGDYDTAAFELK